MIGILAIVAVVAQTPTLFDAQRFDTKGLPKADNLEIILNFPAGWEARPGRHPHVVEEFLGSASASNCNIAVRNLGATVPKVQVINMLREVSSAPAGMKLIGQEATTVDSLPGLSTTYAGTVSSGGLSASMVQVSLATVYGRDLIVLTCGKGMRSSDTKDDVTDALAMFGRIGNSIVIKNQWGD